jgi:hypothetical protein
VSKLWNVNFDDTLVRNFLIKFFKETFDMNLYSNPKIRKIDLLSNDDQYLGVEGEHGKFVGNFWENDYYSTISNLGFKTLNVPIRKDKYWLDVVKDKPNLSATKNIFARTNKDFTQVLIIEPETFRNKNKVFKSKFQPNNSKEIEEWLCFKKEDVKTYNLIEGKFVLQPK